ncbi:uncharacterized protein MELLADRAFT_110587 [Melampsora larici-populina 98AG31]|uniref:Uncharacterized protein n=1 Tax=Melampsora larici-populina (strain 98AG31 / pathotype 3-4-7) TaxID=747676 RepID=F4S0A5_MELLP|nr:uncharacterized protein MELLADRAFT_110587 [Melampsora larici-populina 98AG31]EGG01929.1 hypothetical protein MELLADRAFT_110587 [Melampsora larici-populina 98AG31]
MQASNPPDTPTLNAGFVRNPIYLHFLGQAGPLSECDLIKHSGYKSFHSCIATAGVNGKDPYANAVLLTCKDTDRSLKADSLYSMTCRLIASNTANFDHLHFTREDILSLGKPRPGAKNCAAKFINKVASTVHGRIFDREILDDSSDDGEYTILLTLKHVDHDPIGGSVVVWLTKHHVASRLDSTHQVEDCQIGAEVLIHGTVIDYDEVTSCWEFRVRDITICERSDIQPNQVGTSTTEVYDVVHGPRAGLWIRKQTCEVGLRFAATWQSRACCATLLSFGEWVAFSPMALHVNTPELQIVVHKYTGAATLYWSGDILNNITPGNVIDARVIQ